MDNDRRETVRFNPNVRQESRMLDYLGRVHEGKKGAFIKEALDMYIEAIEQGLYVCPYIGEKEEEIVESKFAGVIKQQKNNNSDSLDIFSSLDDNDFLNKIDEQISEEVNSWIAEFDENYEFNQKLNK